jgi:hypothetical protein
MRKYNAQVRNEKKIISTLQEVAYDLRVRVVKSGYGNLFINESKDIRADSVSESYNIERLNQNVNIRIVIDDETHLVEMEFSEDGKFYCIIFKLLGKCYASCGENELMAWNNLIKKARIENKKLFNLYKYGYYDRNKI